MKKLILPALLSFSLTAAATDDLEKYSKALQKIASPQAKVVEIEDSPIAGIKQLLVDLGRGSEVMYISNDGKYLLTGSLFDIEKRKDLTAVKKNSIRKGVMEGFGSDQRINFYPEKDKMKYHISVFTDIDCGYCRKMHKEVKEYNDLGIGISYLFFPRHGLQSESYTKSVNVWCADDQQKAMTMAKSGEELTDKKCDNPVEKHYHSGIAAGVTGTPATVLDDGTLMPGYLPPKQLLQRLEMLQTTNDKK